jgi:hypothetical protein
MLYLQVCGLVRDFSGGCNGKIEFATLDLAQVVEIYGASLRKSGL